MDTDIVRLDLGVRVRSLLAYSAGMALYALVVVALYPAFKTSTSLDSLVKQDPTGAALFGISGPISSSGGWLNANIYANLFPLIMLSMTVGYGAAALAGQDEERTLGLIVSLQHSRTAIVVQKCGAMAAQGAVLAAAVALCVLVGRSFQLTTPATNIIGVSISALLMGLDFGIITLAVGGLNGGRGVALGVGTAPAAVVTFRRLDVH